MGFVPTASDQAALWLHDRAGKMIVDELGFGQPLRRQRATTSGGWMPWRTPRQFDTLRVKWSRCAVVVEDDGESSLPSKPECHFNLAAAVLAATSEFVPRWRLVWPVLRRSAPPSAREPSLADYEIPQCSIIIKIKADEHSLFCHRTSPCSLPRRVNDILVDFSVLATT